MLDSEDEEPGEGEEEEEERDRKPKVKKAKKKVKKAEKEEDEEPEEEDEIQEDENPYTVTNRSIDELVNPKDTMFDLSPKEVELIIKAYEIALLPTYFGEQPVLELVDYADKLKHHLLSKHGKGRKDIMRVLKYSNGMTNENVNKSIFKQLLEGGKEEESE